MDYVPTNIRNSVTDSTVSWETKANVFPGRSDDSWHFFFPENKKNAFSALFFCSILLRKRSGRWGGGGGNVEEPDAATWRPFFSLFPLAISFILFLTSSSGRLSFDHISLRTCKSVNDCSFPFAAFWIAEVAVLDCICISINFFFVENGSLKIAWMAHLEIGNELGPFLSECRHSEFLFMRKVSPWI